MSFVHLKDAVESSRRSRHLVASCGFAFKLATHTRAQKNNASCGSEWECECQALKVCHKRELSQGKMLTPTHSLTHTHTETNTAVCARHCLTYKMAATKGDCEARERFKKRQLPFIKASCKTILYECVCVRECTEVCVCTFICGILFSKTVAPSIPPPRLLPAYFMAHTL